jgi:ATP:cob(I)alamin adenosyltransferase
MTAGMSIVTKTGDKGKTDLFGGRQVSKDDLRIEVLGDLDELCSFLGLAKSLVKNKQAKVIIENIQRDLFIMGSEVATEARHIGKLKCRICQAHILGLEKRIEQMERGMNLWQPGFCLPGKNTPAAITDIARTIARRVERRIVTFSRRKSFKNADVLIYLNRLSDLLFILARRLENYR